MSGFFWADPAAMKSAAASADDLADSLRAVPYGEGLQQMATAIPGSLSATYATPLESTWKDWVVAWAQDMRAHANAIRAAASGYQSSDAISAVTFVKLAPPEGPGLGGVGPGGGG